MIKELRLARRMTSVQRLAGTPHILNYNILEHGAKCLQLYTIVHNGRGDVLDAWFMSFLLNHDQLEVYSGDLLYPAKHLNEEAWEQVERAILDHYARGCTIVHDGMLKGADRLMLEFKTIDICELWLHCAEEIAAGNKHPAIFDVLNTIQEVLTAYRDLACALGEVELFDTYHDLVKDYVREVTAHAI